MPSFQLLLVLPKAEKPALKTMLKRAASYILDEGGVLKKMENLGCQQTPYKMITKSKKHTEANFFTLDFDMSMDGKTALKDKLKRDVEVVRTRIFLEKSPYSLKDTPEYECDLYLDLLPPPYRPSVIEMMNVKSRSQKRKLRFDFNTGLDYCPF